MKGWRNESGRHALAARGIPTSYHIRLMPFMDLSGKFQEIEGHGGWLTLYDKEGKEIGRTDIVLHHKKITYPFGMRVPANTAITSSFEIYRAKDRNKGYGSEILSRIEKYAKKNGMKRIWAIHVGNDEYFLKHGYKHTGIRRIYEKVL